MRQQESVVIDGFTLVVTPQAGQDPWRVSVYDSSGKLYSFGDFADKPVAVQYGVDRIREAQAKGVK